LTLTRAGRRLPMMTLAAIIVGAVIGVGVALANSYPYASNHYFPTGSSVTDSNSESLHQNTMIILDYTSRYAADELVTNGGAYISGTYAQGQGSAAFYLNGGPAITGHPKCETPAPYIGNYHANCDWAP
jgi:hypothetical protein